MNNALSTQAYVPKTFDEWWHLCTIIAESDLCPKIYRNKPGNVFIAAQMGAEVGLNYMQAVQGIMVINGLPCLWGDAALAVVMTHKDFDGIEEFGDEKSATCIVKRKGRKDVTQTFTVEQAQKAGLLAKGGPWLYLKRMLQMRARSFGLRDQFPDALRGINIAEEVQDYQPMEKNVTPKPYEASMEGFKPTLTTTPNEPDIDSEFLLLKDKLEGVDNMDALQLLTLSLHAYAGCEANKNKLRVSYKEKIGKLSEELQRENDSIVGTDVDVIAPETTINLSSYQPEQGQDVI